MQKWEYLVVGNIDFYYGNLNDSGLTQVTLFSHNGWEIIKDFNILPKDVHKRDAFSQYIASLGEEGWEMVGAGNTSESRHCIYFKRPKE